MVLKVKYFVAIKTVKRHFWYSLKTRCALVYRLKGWANSAGRGISCFCLNSIKSMTEGPGLIKNNLLTLDLSYSEAYDYFKYTFDWGLAMKRLRTFILKIKSLVKLRKSAIQGPRLIKTPLVGMGSITVFKTIRTIFLKSAGELVHKFCKTVSTMSLPSQWLTNSEIRRPPDPPSTNRLFYPPVGNAHSHSLVTVQSSLHWWAPVRPSSGAMTLGTRH